MTSLYDEVQAAPAPGVVTRRVTIKVNGDDRTVDVEHAYCLHTYCAKV